MNVFFKGFSIFFENLLRCKIVLFDEEILKLFYIKYIDFYSKIFSD